MKRLALIVAILALGACRTNEDNLATSEALNDRAATQWARVDAEDTRVAGLPSPAPVPAATATANAALEYLRTEAVAYNVREAERRLDLTRTPLASPGPATVAAAIATTERIKAEADFYEKWRAGQVVVATVTPVPLPTVTPVPVATPTPVEVCALVDLNSASTKAIAELPADSLGRRLGLERAGWIEAYRDQNPIILLDDLLGIAGIGPRTVAAIRASECTLQR